MMHTSTRCVPPVTNKIDKVVTNPINVVKPEVNTVETPTTNNNTTTSKPTTFKGYKLLRKPYTL